MSNVELQGIFIFIIVRRNVSQLLAGRVQEIAKKLRTMEKEYFTKRKELGGDDEMTLDKQLNIGKINEGSNSAEDFEVQEMEQVAMSRDVEIQNLVKGINDLAVIFKELSVLVVDQGNILDRIDYNIEQAVTHTKKANKQLHKSEEYQTSRIRSCIGCLVAAIVIMIIILIIKHI